LPEPLQKQWRELGCDVVFTNKRMYDKPLSSCLSGGTSDISPAHSNMSSTLPLIAVMAATTTRKVSKPSTRNLSLFTYLLPSLMRTVDCGFRYECVLGYDQGDPFYDSEKGMAEVTQWFQNNVQTPMQLNGIQITLRLVRVKNTLKKPGPVFIEMARAAYTAGADYFYRLNDDTELMAAWPSKFVKGLSTLTGPKGVVGPLCNQRNEGILAHDFTARVHMEIFEMNYYPPELTDWWMDDWISLVYGKQRTFRSLEAPVIHHTRSHGRRYTVNLGNAGRLAGLVKRGRGQIRKWMLTHNTPEAQLRAFDLDTFTKFTIKSLPDEP